MILHKFARISLIFPICLLLCFLTETTHPELNKSNPFADYADVCHEIFSRHLQAFRQVHIYLPPSYSESEQNYSVLYINDGQDMKLLKLKKKLNALYLLNKIEEVIVVSIPAGNRMQEYGTASQPDYQKRGSLAGKYSKFIINELMAFVNAQYRTKKLAKSTSFIGFSLGGLTAFDLVWNYPMFFGKAGAFSASFWWRSKAFEDGFKEDKDRIMHNIVKKSNHKRGLKFWFQAGTEDEKSDRNKNGIIDAIDDTLDLMKELRHKGYKNKLDMHYEEVEGGEHNYQTWSAIFPKFMLWAYGTEN
ncbi:MAG: enterochelin esterase-like enzyme [Arenicella sp.]